MTEKTYRMAISSCLFLATLSVVILCAMQISERFTKELKIEAFTTTINLTSDNSQTGLIDFLERNEGKVVFIDSYIDTSLATEEQSIVEQTCSLDIEATLDNRATGTPLSLPIYDDIEQISCWSHSLVLHLGDDSIYEYSSGGTGIVMIRFRGVFEIFQTYHSGPSIYYHLKEVSVPFDTKMALISK